MDEHFGAALRRLRRARDWTQEDLAFMAGVDQASISQYERGKHLPTMEVIGRLARAFKMSTEEVARLAGHLPPEAPAGDIWDRAPLDLLIAALRTLPDFAEHAQIEAAQHMTRATQERLLRQVGRDFGNRIQDEIERQTEERERATTNGGTLIGQH